ncbi:NUDIX hydrolase [Aquipuribacter nitratireducens]|uniref:NUDIX hydrolase n=1 Tax=Aquipuribacter nitratireducens TaxID=650104 RepID=A0ABW0GPK9_9MICO
MTGAPIDRRSARVLLLDGRGRLLLLHGCDPARPATRSWWFTPGGGLDPGESHLQAAARELWEETGLTGVELHGPVAERSAEFTYDGVEYRQHELFYVSRLDAADVAVEPGAHTDVETRALLGWRWWTARELASTEDTVYPEWLPRWLEERSAPS